jgi:putative serine protease PepD
LLGVLLAVGAVVGAAPPGAARASSDSLFATLPDFPVPGGHFFSQASGVGGTAGFTVVDDGAAAMFSEFTRLGSADKLGFPASQRFPFGGFLTQATQKELLQWRPEIGQAEFVNIFDVLSQRGLDPLLAQSQLIPPIGDNAADAHLTWPQVVARHLALLDQNPAIKERYFADPNPVQDYGLPQGVGDFGGVYVIRCERATFQYWRVATPFARSGDVTQVNAGDLAKQFGIVPAPAQSPTPAANVLVAPPGSLISANATTQAAAREAAATAARSLVRIDVTFADGVGIASGIVLDRNGDILTNQHVVDSAEGLKVTLPNGTVLAAHVRGVNADADLAVIQVPSAAVAGVLVPASVVGGGALTTGQFVVALGYSPYFPALPATRLGVYQRSLNGGLTILRSDTFILPGDSGGMLLDLAGNVVGVNDEIRFTQQSDQPLVGFSIDAAQALQVAGQLIQ